MPYLTRLQVMAQLGLSSITLTRRIAAGELPAPHVFGRSQLIDQNDLEVCLQTINPGLLAIVPVKNPGIRELGLGVYACPARGGLWIGSRRPGHLVLATSDNPYPPVHKVVAIAHADRSRIDSAVSTLLSAAQRRLALSIAAAPHRQVDLPITVFFLGDQVGTVDLPRPPQRGLIRALSLVPVTKAVKT